MDSRDLCAFVAVKINHSLAFLMVASPQKEEEFYTVSWAVGDNGSPLLACSGSNGVIRIVDCGKGSFLKSFIGHGDSVNELRTQTLKPCLIASASKDESVRLWNVNTGVCILIFAGAGGHRNEVLSVDFHPSDVLKIASCGMDNTIKIWSLKEFWRYVEMSLTWSEIPSKFPTKYVQFPVCHLLDSCIYPVGEETLRHICLCAENHK